MKLKFPNSKIFGAAQIALGLITSLLAISNATAAVTGTAYRDFNSNGVRDVTEPGVSGVTVNVYGSGPLEGTLCASTTTAANGTYSVLSTAQQSAVNCSLVNGSTGAVDEYRLEFVPPAGPLTASFSAPVAPLVGSNSNTYIRIIGDGATAPLTVADINLALQNPGDYCPMYTEQTNGGDTSTVSPPTASIMLASPIAIGPTGPGTLPPTSRSVLLSYQYESGTASDTDNTGVNLPTRLVHATQGQVGSVRGIAYHRRSNTLLAAAFAKRHTTFPDGDLGTAGQQINNAGPDRIYGVDRDTNTLTTFATQEAGSDLHDLAALHQDNGYWDQVGRAAWGDIDMLEDDSALYGSNMGDKLLYRIPVTFNAGANTISSGAPASVYSLTVLNAAVRASGACNLVGSATASDDNDWVLGAIKAKDGQVYFGVTCTAQALGEAYAVGAGERCEGGVAQGIGASAANTTTNNNPFGFAAGFVPLRSVVFSFNPSSPGAAPTLVTSVPLNYDRDGASAGNTTAEWLPWRPTQPVSATPRPEDGCGRTYDNPFGQAYYVQPWLTDIEFDENNNMLLGLNDRGAEQFGNVNAIGGGSGNFEGVAAGDIVRVPFNVAANNWPASGADGEFHRGEQFTLTGATHNEIGLGSMAVVLGRDEVVVNAFDPPPTGSAVNQLPPNQGSTTNSFQSGGVVWLSSSGGATATANRNRSYLLFTRAEAGSFGKASGVGDIEALCAPAPVQIGSRVFVDRNNDGIQGVNNDGGANGESGITNVVLALLDASNNVIGRVTTSSTSINPGDGTSGQYFFTLTQSSVADPDTTDSTVFLPNPYGQNLKVVIDLPATIALNPTFAFNVLSAADAAGATGTAGATSVDQRDSDFTIQTSGAFVNAPTALVTTGGPGQNNHSVDAGFRRPIDFGDLPNTYGTLTNSPVPGHYQSAALLLGPTWDDNTQGLPSTAADGDGADEDGFAVVPFIIGASNSVTVNLTNTTGVAANLCAYFDWNNDGDFGDTGEIATASAANLATSATFSVTPPGGSPAGPKYARFRLTDSLNILSAGNCTLAAGSSGGSAFIDQWLGEIEDYVVPLGLPPSVDFGDLPDSAAGTGSGNYQTLSSDNGPSHTFNANLRIGATTDGELNGVPSATANGDDLATDDEETTIPTLFGANSVIISVPTHNSSGVAAGLCGFLDINADGDFADAGEAAFAAAPNGTVVGAPLILNFNNLASALVPPAASFVRLRLAQEYLSLASCSPVGSAVTGEVEDHPIAIAPPDFGDLPDLGAGNGPGNYNTNIATNGPYHTVSANVRLGTLAPDAEANGNPSSPASGDGADEDSATPAQLVGIPGLPYSITLPLATNAAARVCGYIDLDGDGLFTSPNETATVTVAPAATSALLAFGTLPSPLPSGNTYARFRIGDSATFTTCSPNAFGFGGTGEVEDYVFRISGQDFGDLPDTGAGVSTGNYQTLLVNNGPRHNVIPGLNLGTLIDEETNGVPGALANGDDNDATDDEDAFAASITGTAGSLLSLPAFNVNNGTGSTAGVCAFFDGNRDGDFADANERVFATVPAANGSVSLPPGLIPLAASGNGANYLRLRLSSDYTGIANCDADLGVGIPNGGATDNGEVEDYPVTIAATTDIAVDKEDSQSTYNPGESLNYIITIFNNGTQGANGVTMTDVFPITPYNQFARVDWSVLDTTGPGAVCLAGCSGSATSIPPGNITQSGIFASFNLVPGGAVRLQVQAITVNPVLPTTAATITNTAVLGFPPEVTDTDSSNNIEGDVDTVSGTIGTGTTRPICGLPGGNGALTISGANTVVNTYYTLPAATAMPAPGGSRCVPIDVASAIPSALAPVVGDLLLIVQMQDGTFNPANSTNYGGTASDGANDGSGYSALQNAGLYEYALVTEAVGTGGCAANQVRVRAGGTGFGLINSYAHTPTATTNRETVQIVRVPQYTDLTLTGAGSIDAAPWDGLRGGVTVIDVRDTLALNGTAGDKVCANGDGFRGGGAYAAPVSGGGGFGDAFAGTIAAAVTGGVKAEGIVGTPRFVYNGSSTVDLGSGNEGYAGGALRRGGPGNAGGGGNACTTSSNTDRTGGGGGSNGQIGGLGGNPAASCTGTFGGIRGGSIEPANPLRATAGGGGGSGASDAATGSEGGRGGGSVFVRAGTVTGVGAFCARGSSGNAGTGLNGAGGGGAGGTVLLLINVANTVPSGLSIDVRGGNGGNSPSAGGGAGGGGGRGFVSQFTGASVGFTGDGGTQGSGTGSNNAQSGTGASLQTGLNPYNVTPGPKPGFLCSNGTVPVTLSKVAVSQEGSEMVVRFSTASEAGTLGYRVLADVGPSASFSRTELGYVDSKAIDSLKEQSYELRSRSIGASQIWIEEQSITGKAELYGPYAVGKTVGESNLAPAMNWAAVNAEQASFRTSQQSNLRGQSTGRAEVSVSADGWVSFNGAELAAAGLTGSDIAVSQGSRSVASKIERSGGSITRLGFYGRAVSGSIYTKTAVYSLSSGSASAIAMQNAVATSGASAVMSDMIFDQNALYSFTAPSDPWFNFRALRNVSGTSNGGSSSFTLSDYAGAGAERLMLSYWGGSSYSGAGNDHSVQFLLNGQVIGSDRFDGFASRTLDLAIPAGALRSGQNTLSLQMVNDTGFASDIVNVESYTLRYRRNLVASGNRLNVAIRAIEGSDSFANGFEDAQVASGGPSSYTISNLTAPAVVLLERAGAQTLLATSSGASVSVQFDAQIGDRLIVSPVQSTLSLTAASSAVDPIGSTPATYLIISHPSFIGGLSSFVTAKQQQGFTVKVVDVEALYRYYNAGVVDPAAISLAIKNAQKLGVTNVLLIGGDTYDYLNVLGINSVSFVPTNYRRTDAIVNFAPADSVYADTDNNGAPNVALGRWPLRTQAELQAVIAKTLSYQNSRKAVLVNDRALNGERYSQVAAPFAALLPQDWSRSLVDLDSYTDTAIARTEIVSQLSQGASLLSYYGHSAPASWSREGLITATQLSNGLMSGVNQSFVTVQLGCWGTYFVEPTSTTVAHQLLLMPKGAAAVMGASTLTQTNSDKLFAGYVLPNFGSQSIGNTLKGALEAMSQEADANDVTVGGTLLGDPSLR